MRQEHIASMHTRGATITSMHTSASFSLHRGHVTNTLMSTYSLPGASSEGDHGQRGRCPEGSLALQGLQGLREEDPGAYLQSRGVIKYQP